MSRKQADFDAMKRELQTTAARVAIDALIAVCADAAASSQARATAGSTLLRFSGLDRDESPDPDAKPLEEMSAAELAKRAERGWQMIEALERGLSGEASDDQEGTDVFD